MTVTALVALVEAVVASVALIVCARVAGQSSRASAEIVASTAFREQLLQRVAALEAEVKELWDKRREDALTIRAMGDHIDKLEGHIWEGLPPPPPPRPGGV
ncbi:MAG: hypothetical protein LBJ44_05830 [Propionibacteriaceae bacterium]|nr:hypothetical protein [Propionibacteriaceae bacterium]